MNSKPRRAGINSDRLAFHEGLFDRRSFVALTAALGAWTPIAATGSGQPADGAPGDSTSSDSKPQQKAQETPVQQKPPLPPLRNAQAPAIQFQASPSGSAAYVESLGQRDGGAACGEIDVAPWVGRLPSSDEEIAFLPVHRLAALIQTGQLSPVQLTDIYLERLKRLNEKLLCAVTLMEESARSAARQAEEDISGGHYRGPLHGIPWGVKDLFSTKGVVTSWGAKPFEHRVIDEDAEVVVRLRRAGAILVAKLATGTFAYGDRWFRGKTRNPWNLEEGSSGSSAGPGSATAAGCVGFAIGTETTGSIVSPARRCGISALRPTFGRVSRRGCMTLSWSLDKVGPMCRTIEDCAIVFDAIHGADGGDPSCLTAPFCFQRSPDLSKLSIGYSSDADGDFVEQLGQLGAQPRLMPDPPDARAVRNILDIEAAAAFDDFISNHLDNEMVRKSRAESFRAARNATALDYLNAQRRRYALMLEMRDYLSGIDLYVSGSGDVGLTNLTGHPAAVVPYKISEGQPRCITLIGDLFADDTILSVANAYQASTKWHLEHPVIA